MTSYCRWLIVWCWLWALAALPLVTDTGSALGWQVLLFSAGCVIVFCWLWHSVRFPGVLKRKRARWLWLSVPMALVMVTVLGVTNLGLAYRVWLCDPELREFAEAVRAGNKREAFPGLGKWVGLFFVQETDGNGTKALLMTSCGFPNSYGIAYSPERVPIGSGNDHQHLYGPWYRYTDDF